MTGLAPALVGLGGILLLAAILGQLLREAIAPDGSHPLIETMNARIAAWWAFAMLMALALLAGKAGVIGLFLLVSFSALREFLTLTKKSVADHWTLAASFFLVLPLQYLFVAAGWQSLMALFVPVHVFLILPVISALRGQPEQFLARVAETQWAVMICVYCVSFIPALLWLPIPGFEGRNLLLIAFLILVVQTSDIAQFAISRGVGRRRIAPALSASKTWEGTAGGMAVAGLIGGALSWLTPFTPVQAMGVGLVLALMGGVGDLVMTAIKRDKGTRDWGHLIAPHGGFLDRLDSVIFAAPIFYQLIRVFWTTP
ncbi:phosphatidate cytidylyltransferase [Rhodobacter capsulatus]|uniref:phosphatidate cytidylyltransferase n=1 Tax=Rhodobacter capsulatus TaxID=1061 RepID=UPI0003D38C28|nr:phosphatidate cytidylyltransferase [Rhodobacter capsulatus]ETD84591.1 phosphatidate cytidylyltransferase [Rhodobacter capsulatus YW1]